MVEKQERDYKGHTQYFLSPTFLSSSLKSQEWKEEERELGEGKIWAKQ